MVRLPHLVVIGAVAAMAFSASAQQRTSPPRPPGGGVPPGSYQQTCRGISLNGNLLRAQCTNERGAPVSSTLDTNSCRGSDIRNDNGYLRCGPGGGGPRPPVPPGPGPRPPEPPRPPSGGAFEVIAYTRANYSGQQLQRQYPLDPGHPRPGPDLRRRPLSRTLHHDQPLNRRSEPCRHGQQGLLDPLTCTGPGCNRGRTSAAQDSRPTISRAVDLIMRHTSAI
jgi:CVNH domain